MAPSAKAQAVMPSWQPASSTVSSLKLRTAGRAERLSPAPVLEPVPLRCQQRELGGDEERAEDDPEDGHNDDRDRVAHRRSSSIAGADDAAAPSGWWVMSWSASSSTCNPGRDVPLDFEDLEAQVLETRGLGARHAWTTKVDRDGVLVPNPSPEGLYGRRRITAYRRRTTVPDA